MTPTQKIQIKMSETREKLNGMIEVRDGDTAKLAERQKLVDEIQELEVELRAAIKADDTAPETREWADVSSRFDLGELFEGVMEHRASSGAIAEVQKERGLAANAIPTEMLMEKRNVTPAPSDVGQSQNAIEGYVFPNSVADFLGMCQARSCPLATPRFLYSRRTLRRVYPPRMALRQSLMECSAPTC